MKFIHKESISKDNKSTLRKQTVSISFEENDWT
jgi:hypothetical protein